MEATDFWSEKFGNVSPFHTAASFGLMHSVCFSRCKIFEVGLPHQLQASYIEISVSLLVDKPLALSACTYAGQRRRPTALGFPNESILKAHRVLHPFQE